MSSADLEGTENFNRLRRLGLPNCAVLKVLAGEVDEESEVQYWAEQRAVEQWKKDPTNRDLVFEPKWDLDPSRYYLALDSKNPSDVPMATWTPVLVEVADLRATLVFGSARDKDPWAKEYKYKTARTAYRWANGLSVTPPLIRPYASAIAIAGGLHRFHLAAHYDAEMLPVLVRVDELKAVAAIIELHPL